MLYSPWRLHTYPWHFHSKDGQQQDARSDASVRLTWRSEKLVATSKRKMKYFYKRPRNRWINPTSQEWPTSIFSQQNQYTIREKGYENWLSDRAISVWPWKMVSVSVCYLFYQPMDEKIKTWPLRFPAKENPHMEKTLFDWPIVLQYNVKARHRLIPRKLFGHEVFSPECFEKPRVFVSVR